ncbi:DUF2975 domain-containing protein [Jiulongibacter sp. NS-SX5]|uniref:DUF2975 domain-containing protein n=1 Tax=Jiulongibacter sp. NS-SX5 TaxID=3463854 RepID=UPI00405832F3
MSRQNDFIFKALKVISWIIFVGLCIEAGGLLTNFAFSIFKPEMVSRLYQKLDLSILYTQSPFSFFSMYTLAIAIALLKCVLFYQVILLVSALDLSQPFNEKVGLQVAQISYSTFSIGLLSLIARQSAKNLLKRGLDVEQMNQFWSDGQAFILMAAVIYIIAVIFKKGVELQNEQDLTV